MSTPHLSALSLQVTDACNLACSYCYFYEKEPVAITPEIVDRALDLLAADSAPESTDWHINLFGGEPTLRGDLIDHICRESTRRAAACGKQVTFSMTTNGTRFTPQMLDLITGHDIATMLSIDGNEQAHDRFRRYLDGRGSYRKILENLPRLMQAPHFKVRLTISPMTVEYLSASVEELLGLGIRDIATSPVAEQEWTPAHFAEFAAQWQRVGALYIRERLAGAPVSIKGIDSLDEEEPLSICAGNREYGCGAATSFVFVNVFGDLYPCHRFPGYFSKSEHVRLGSVFTGIDADRRMHYVMANRASSKKGCHAFVGSPGETGACGDCLIQGVCGGSCMAINEFVTGDPTQPPSVPGRLEQIKLEVLTQVHEYLAARAG
ncbi:PapB family radical SAM/SPASM ranthipeptide maturase [Trujillonella endophytica]|uniref:PapB family radical SAM/SPASM ranthipeptide maturase n=1 Tax=Trujillonella endophytica TaxID=673521 RepID=UPI00147F27A0|nr:radical SAM protein [Trujillella endophytica]